MDHKLTKKQTNTNNNNNKNTTLWKIYKKTWAIVWIASRHVRNTFGNIQEYNNTFTQKQTTNKKQISAGSDCCLVTERLVTVFRMCFDRLQTFTGVCKRPQTSAALGRRPAYFPFLLRLCVRVCSECVLTVSRHLQMSADVHRRLMTSADVLHLFRSCSVCVPFVFRLCSDRLQTSSGVCRRPLTSVDIG